VAAFAPHCAFGRTSFVEPQEAFLVRPDLMDPHVVESGIRVLPDRGHVPLGIRSAGHRLGHVILGHGLGGLLEMPRERKLDSQLAADGRVRPPLARGPAGGRLVLGPAHMDLAEPGLAGTPGFLEPLHRVPVGRHGDQTVPDPAGKLDGPISLRGNQHRRRPFGKVVDASLLHGEVPASVRGEIAVP
jgi:hypothetical protein